MDGGDSSSALHAPRAETTVSSQSFDQCGLVREMDDSQLVGVPLAVAGDAAVPVKAGEPQQVPPSAVQLNKTTLGAVGQVMEKRKRGRPPKGHAALAPAPAPPKPPPPKRNKEEEDVCFICFDGGSLVLCDRKGCPKAYHPACIKRDEAFFRSKAKWNCGWHICSVCQKAAHYMCYTCTYSLCKGCTKDAEYVCVRGNKGFCTTCMRTIMLIENKDLGNSEVVQVDFDDKTSWEYLFKVYWLYLKSNLSLTINELMQAKNPWRGLAMMDYKQQLPARNHFANGCMVTISDHSVHLESKVPKEQPELLNHDSFLNTEKINSDKVTNLAECKEWASKELLELVAHVRNGDTSMLSQFDVQALLLEYIKRNNLRDPRRKSQIICDLRLKNLFGKPRVGHIEMLKLLEYHFLIKEDDQNNAFIPAGIVGSVGGNVGVDQKNSLMVNQGKKRKTRRKGEEKTPQTNLDDYAAIDLHNINLIYLRRNLLENLLGDEEKFHDKVVGSVVRIRVSCNDQKQDIYRLVQVVGTSKASMAYKLGDKMTHVMLEVLNLNKKETTSIEAISNQEFSQEECRRLRQSIRCGLVKHWTVGEIQTKAFALQAVKLNDVLEAEILRLNHLRDRANEKGHKKQLRECIEKLQLLKTPEERQRRLTEIPKVHADPKMNPNYKSEEDIAGELLKSKISSFNKNESQSISPKSRAKEDGMNRSQQSRQKRDARGRSGPAKNEMQVPVSGSESGSGNQQVVRFGSETSSATLPTGSSTPANTSETEKIWHYRDPNGRIQGPFAMVQLRKWSTTGYFPADMRIWTINELDESVLLIDALNEFFHKDYRSLHNVSRPQENGPASDNGTLHSFNPDQTFVAPLHQERGYGIEELKSVLDHENQSPHETPTDQATGVQCNEKSSSSQSYVGQSSGQNCRSVPLNLDLNRKDCNSSLASVTTPSDSAEQQGDIDILDLPSPTPKTSKSNLEGQDVEKQESGFDGHVQGSEKSDLPSPSPKPIDDDVPDPTPEPMDEDLAGTTYPPKNEVLPSPSPIPTGGDDREQIDKTNQSPLPKVSVPDSGPGWNSTSGLRVGGAQLQKIADEWDGYSPTDPKPSVQEWDTSLAPVASLKPPEVLGDHVTSGSINNTTQLVHASPCQPASNISSWQAIVNEPIEFSTLAEESVSDLLAEVDAMESQSGLASPTSGMKCSDEMMDSCRNDCFSSIEELSPTADAGKSDAVSSNREAQFPPSVTDDPGGTSQADGFDRLKASGGHSTSSSEGETKSADAPVDPRETGLDVHPPPACTMSQGMVGSTMARNRGMESMDAGWAGVPGNMNMGWGGSPQGFPNMGWGSGMVPPWGNPSYNLGGYNGSLPWDSPRRYNGERFAGPRDWGFQGGDSGFGRGRPMWSRQSHGGGGGGYSRPPHKGQRVCKFYESGHCKKGASCDYLHP
ncbi:zinc finger CCCH domain-containing protein 44 [Coffea eugenioides]|uniref:zinc finger CCCH domain-containing protein 44 n=1 Tax=Coffea eugenioides TaxID=49369 RepID=UPI000F60AAA1|nr:zinc finger CCCH domain-containing protein 44 [Coffea eugenioides]